MPVPDELNDSMSKRILIVDDDIGIIHSLKRALRMEHKYVIDAAINGFEAGRKLLEFRPDLVILDIKMPGLDGYEVARKIKEIPSGRHIRIIAISAYFGDTEKRRMLSCGVDVCMDKPFDNEELLQRINQLLNAGNGRL